MAFFRRWPAVVCALVLVLSAAPLLADNVRENREFSAAAAAFQTGMYNRADAAFAQFVTKYPDSPRVAEAILLQAQAELKMGDYASAVRRLTNPANLARAGQSTDQYVYWLGEAQFQATNFLAAAETWMRLAQQFPLSRLRLPASVEAAAALTVLEQWQRVVALLGPATSVFQSEAQKDPGGEQIARGQLLLAQARFMLKDFDGASAILEPLLELKGLGTDRKHQCALLLYQVKFGAGDTEAALAVTTNLLQIARLEKNDAGRAEGLSLRGEALEKLGRPAEAIAAYQENLTNAPVRWQREAVLKIAALAIAQNQLVVATNALQKLLAQFPDSPVADVAQLTLAELGLKQAAGQPADTNQLAELQGRLDLFIGTFTNSPLRGKAYLDRGWCHWLATNLPASLADFQQAAALLPLSEDLAVARFKVGDVLLMQGKFAEARTNFMSVLDDFTIFPPVNQSLGEQALYQCLRANLALNDGAGANTNLARILRSYPEGDLSDNAILLVAESVDDAHRTEAARELLLEFERQFPHSELLPQARLAVARTYEQHQSWRLAITNYEGWLQNFPTNDLRPQAAYSLAWANFQSGDETNAFVQFTNFVAQFSTNDLAPLAQWWVADHYFSAGDFENAERNYKTIFQNAGWQGSPLVSRTNLFYPAQLMAGRAAAARLDYTGAMRDYFTKLEQDTNCPLDLRVQATFEHGFALMRADSTDTNNPLANFGPATNEFVQIIQLCPTNPPGLLAWFYLGECNVQLANYGAATNAYAMVFNSPFAGIAARSQAQIGFGIALEKMAALASGTASTNLLNAALDNYLSVFNGLNLRGDEKADPFWLKKAGLQAAPLVGLLNDPDVQRNFYGSLARLLPQLADSIAKKIAALPPPKN